MQRRPTNTPPESVDANVKGYDWTRFGRHRLRTAAAALLDHPLGGGWTATTWPGPTKDPSG